MTPNAQGDRKTYPIVAWRPLWDIAICYLPIAGAVLLSLRVSWYFYPLSALIIANRFLALSLLCHEGLHGNLAANRRINDFVGRWLCAYPSMISFSKYRRLHHLHHWAIGSERWDPDRGLFDIYPVSAAKYVSGSIRNLITFTTSWRFAQYYVLPEDLRPRRALALTLSKTSDLIPFLIFHIVLFSFVIYFGLWIKYELFYVLPIVVILQPYVVLMGGLQHGPVREGRQPELVSRSIRGPKWMMEILLPCDINFHAEHHMSPSVPHYWLRNFSRDLEKSGAATWNETYGKSVAGLFSPKADAAEVTSSQASALG